jgi:hypothetical protein
MQPGSICSPIVADWSALSLEIACTGMIYQQIHHSLGDSICVLRKHCAIRVVHFVSLRHCSVGIDRFDIGVEKPDDRKPCRYSGIRMPCVHLEALLSRSDSGSRFGMMPIHPREEGLRDTRPVAIRPRLFLHACGGADMRG